MGQLCISIVWIFAPKMRQIRTIYQYVTAVYYIIIIILLKAADRELRNNCGKSPVKELLDL